MKCDYCGREGPLHREHMIPKALGGTDDPSNLARACQPCNSRKGTAVGIWLPCGRASWVGDYCLDLACLTCAPRQLAHEGDRLALRHAGLMVRHATTRRDQLIREAVASGGSLREVGAAVGLSHMAVKFIAHGRPAK